MIQADFQGFRVPARLGLAPQEVHIWLALLDREGENLPHSARMLCADECSRARRFYFATDRRRFIIRRALLRKILSRYLGTDPGEIPFSYGTYGKPVLSGEWSSSGIQFSLSHSHGLAMYAVTRGRRIGLDLEIIEELPDLDQMAACFFSPEEQADLHQLSPQLKRQRFFHGWACKEAYLKATGKGLTYPLNQVSISLDPAEPPRLLEPESAGQGSPWSFRILSPAPNAVAALAVEGHEYSLHYQLWQPGPGSFGGHQRRVILKQ